MINKHTTWFDISVDFSQEKSLMSYSGRLRGVSSFVRIGDKICRHWHAICMTRKKAFNI